jgi:uncharacterized protein involved in exopolysaccharide biosynthesis
MQQPIQTYNQPYMCEEDEIDIKEIIKTILKYKNFILLFTLTITILATIYAFFKTPIFRVKATLQTGYILSYQNNLYQKIYLINPYTLKSFIKNNFDNSDNDKNPYPKVNVNIEKNTKDILNIAIDAFSNNEAINYLNTIISTIKRKEDKKIKIYFNNIKNQITILQNHIKNLTQQIKTLKKQLNYIKDPNIYKTLLDTITKNQQEIVNTKLKITNLKTKLSPINLAKTSIVGKIKKHNHPIKPKKKLIITVAFITSLILSIFLVFFIEFVKNLNLNEE